MTDANRIKIDLSRCFELIKSSSTTRDFFVYLSTYLEIVYGSDDLVSIMDNWEKTELESHSTERAKVETKITSFWYAWQELKAFWSLHTYADKIQTDLAEGSIDEKGDMVVSNPEAAIVASILKSDIYRIFKDNDDRNNIYIKTVAYRRHVSLVNLKIMKSLDDSTPQVISRMGQYEVKDDGNIYYKSKAINLGPQLRRLLEALIKGQGKPVSRNIIFDAMWSEETGTRFIDNPKNADRTNAQISNKVSELNSKLFNNAKRNPIINTKNTTYRFVP